MGLCGCGAVTIRGWLLYEPRLLTGQIRYLLYKPHKDLCRVQYIPLICWS